MGLESPEKIITKTPQPAQEQMPTFKGGLETTPDLQEILDELAESAVEVHNYGVEATREPPLTSEGKSRHRFVSFEGKSARFSKEADGRIFLILKDKEGNEEKYEYAGGLVTRVTN